MNDSMLRERSNHTALLTVWAVLIGCVVVGSLAPAASSLMVAVGRLHVWDKLLHFGAYLALSFLPVIGFRDRRRGLMAGLSMFLLGILMEAGQHFSPGRADYWMENGGPCSPTGERLEAVIDDDLAGQRHDGATLARSGKISQSGPS